MTNAHQAGLVAECIRSGAAALRVPTEKGDASVTLSIGVIEMDHALQAESVDEMFQRVDRTMYAAKQAGRNRIEIFISP